MTARTAEMTIFRCDAESILGILQGTTGAKMGIIVYPSRRATLFNQLKPE
jgi:hypothetical protein